MNELLEVQQQIRELEKDIQSLDSKIQNVNKTLNHIQKGKKKYTVDYRQISRLAKNIPFKSHPISNVQNEKISKLYAIVLLNIAKNESERKDIPESLIFIQWILQQSGIEYSIQDLLVELYKQNIETYEEVLRFPKDIQDSLIVDMFLVLHLCDKKQRSAQKRSKDYILNLLSIMHLEEKRIRVLSAVARSVLCQKVDEKSSAKEIADDFGHELKKYSYYLLDNFSYGYEIIWKCRPVEIVGNVNWKIDSSQEVEKDQVIASVTKKQIGMGKINKEKTEIVVNEPGKVYFFRNDYIYYAVWTPLCCVESKERIKQWALKSEREKSNGTDRNTGKNQKYRTPAFGFRI